MRNVKSACTWLRYLLFAAVLLMSLPFAAMAENTDAAAQENVTVPAVSVKEKKGKLYLLDSHGKTVKSKSTKKAQVYLFDGKYYAVDHKGVLKTDEWFTIGKKLYRAKKNGVLFANTTKEGVTFTEKAYAVNNTAAKLKVKTMEIVQEITNSKMTKSQKLRACWNYMVLRSRWRYRGYSKGIRKNGSGVDGWYYTHALYMFNTHTGSCFNWSACFAALAREVGYDPYIINGCRYKIKNGKKVLTRHSWVKISGLYYDPEMEWSHRSGCYAKKTYTLLQSRFKYKKTFSYRFAGKK